MKNELLRHKMISNMRQILVQALRAENEQLRTANLKLSDEVARLRRNYEPWWKHQDDSVTKNDVTRLPVTLVKTPS